MQTLGFVLAIVGMCIEIVGAFILAADAIGLERIRIWTSRIMNALDDLENPDKPTKKEFRRSRGRRWHFLLTLTITLVVTSSVVYFADIGKETPKVVLWAVALGTGIACGGAAVAGAMLLRVFLGRSADFLIFIENETRIRAAGTIGFGLLLLGFVFQLSGTMFQYFSQYIVGV